MSLASTTPQRLLMRSDDSLPWEDESVERLDAARRLLVGSYWRERASAELRVSAAFSELLGKLRAIDASPDVTSMLALSVDNELHHAAMCERLATRYLGTPIPRPEPGPIHLPPLPQLDLPAQAMVYAAGMCAINESVATVWLELCLARSVVPLARAVNHVHLADEVVHARVGWAHLASDGVTRDMRRELARWLPPLLHANIGQWLRATAVRDVSVPEHGIPDASDQRAQVLGAVNNVVLPGFHHVGVDISCAIAWFRNQFS